MDTPTLITTPTPKAREGAWLWLYKIFAGLMIVVLLGLHFVVNHMVAPGGLLSYADVIRYYQNPVIPIMEIVFLVFVVSHALIGLRSIILDLNPSDFVLRLIDPALIALGAGSILYGIWLALKIASLGG
jgi:succinate dehydrogenase / fumarate reductase membrane anchor subunit